MWFSYREKLLAALASAWGLLLALAQYDGDQVLFNETVAH
jgi:hypothetical protein